MIFWSSNFLVHVNVLASAAKATSTALRIIELLNPHSLGRDDALQDELRDAVASLDLVVGLSVVEEDHADSTSVISVDDAGARVDEVFRGETRAGGDAAVCQSIKA